jgi:hypothetical protein
VALVELPSRYRPEQQCKLVAAALHGRETGIVALVARSQGSRCLKDSERKQ